MMMSVVAPRVISLTQDQISQLAKIAKEALPNESCAFLLGRVDEEENGQSQVTEIAAMANADSSPYSFSIEPSELLKIYDDAEKRHLQVTAIFHSHPGRPSPSGTDIKYMELNPVVWLIYSTTEENFGAHVIDDSGRTKTVELRIRD